MRSNRFVVPFLATAGLLILAFATASATFGSPDSGSPSVLDITTYEYRMSGQPGFGGPALDLILTGTTDLTADGCGADESFAIPPGTDIRFCYFAGNPGSVTFTHHDLSDSQGTIFTGLSTDLPPGFAMYLMQNRRPMASGDFVAQWSAYTPGPTNLVTATDGNPVTITAPLVSCNGATSTFSGGLPVGWTSYDWLALAALPDSDVDWGDLSVATGCGEETNYTGGRGGAACASSDLAAPQAYDTQLRSHSFSLVGQSSARIEFLINYQDFAGGDGFFLDYSLDGGITWENLAQSQNADFGAFRSLPGTAISIDLAPVLGEPDVRLGWRYVNHAGSASDYYAQVDNIRLACGDALFYDGFESGDADAWTEEAE